MANTLSANLSLQTPIREGLSPQDRINLQDAHAANMTILEKVLSGVQSAATTGANASVINTNGNRIVLCQHVGAGSISTIAGAYVGAPFTLIFQSGTSIGIPDSGIFLLNAAFVPSANDSITLVWDGTSYIELARSVN